MIPNVIVDKETRARYLISRSPLDDTGAIATVYSGKLESGAGDSDVAIKIARGGLKSSSVDDFRAEYDRLLALSKTAARPFVPWAHEGEAENQMDRHIIILKMVPKEWQLSVLAEENGGCLPEEIGLLAALQYSVLLVCMHEQVSIVTRGDRKLTDLRWDGQRKQLNVLDWNRAKTIPRELEEEQRQVLTRQDIRVFGHLWSQLLLGIDRALEHLPPLDDAVDPAWSAISRGTRLILSKAYETRTGWSYESAKDLASDLEDHWSAFSQSLNEPATLLQEMKRLRHEAVSLGADSDRAILADRIRTRADLIARSRKSAANQREEADSFDRSAEEELSKRFAWLEQLSSEIETHIKLGEYMTAFESCSKHLNTVIQKNSSAQSAPGRHASLDREDCLALMRLRRWWVLSRIGIMWTKAREDKSAVVPALVDAIKNVDTVASGTSSNQIDTRLLAVQGAHDVLTRALESCSLEVWSAASLIRCELQTRLDWLAGIKAQKDRRETAAADLFNQAYASFQKLEKLSADGGSLHGQAIRVSLPEFDSWIHEQIQRGNQFKCEATGKRFMCAVQAFTEQIKQANLDQPIPWSALDGSIQEALEIFREVVGLNPNAERELGADCAALSEARQLLSLLSIPDEKGALERLSKVRWPESRILGKGFLEPITVHLAIKRLIVFSDGRWPDELDKGSDLREMIELIKEGGLTILPADLELFNRAATRLRQWDKKLQLWKNAFDWTSIASLQDPQKEQAAEDILKDAIKEKIEICERTGLTTEQTRDRSVLSLLVVIQAAKLRRQISELNEETKHLAQELQAQAATLEERLEQTEDLKKRYIEVRIELQEKQNAIPQDQEMLARVQTLCAQWSSLQPNLSAWNNQKKDWNSQAEVLAEQVTKLQGLAGTSKGLISEVLHAVTLLTGEDKTLQKEVGQALVVSEQGTPRIGETLQAIYVLAGLEAARSLEIEASEDFLQKARAILPTPVSRGDNYAGAALALLVQSIQWLENLKLFHPEEFVVAKEWKRQLKLEQADQAREAGKTLCKSENLDSSFWNYWIATQLSNEQHRLDAITEVLKQRTLAQTTEPGGFLLNALYEQEGERLKKAIKEAKSTADNHPGEIVFVIAAEEELKRLLKSASGQAFELCRGQWLRAVESLCDSTDDESEKKRLQDLIGEGKKKS